MNEKSGNLTREQFNDGIQKFVERCQTLQENWFIHCVKNVPEHKYLVKRKRIAATIKNKTQFHNIADDIEETLEESKFDSAVCSKNTELFEEIVTFEYHVLYSPSYNVPVLYFSAWSQDGKLLSLEDIWKQVPEIHEDFLTHDKLSFITQQEHPIFQQPYFLVHPCHTSDMMKQLLRNLSYEKDFSLYLIAWLSAVGPVVGIRLPLQLAAISQDQSL